MATSSAAPVARPRRLRRWLRYSWLSHLPLVGHLFRPRKAQPPPRPSRKHTPLDLVQLAGRFLFLVMLLSHGAPPFRRKDLFSWFHR